MRSSSSPAAIRATRPDASRHASGPYRIKLWMLPNLLSLDAPIIALFWQDLIARSDGLPLRSAGRVVLFLTVWAIYVADRLLDVRKPAPGEEAERHLFYRRHQGAATVLIAVILTIDALLTVLWLRPAVFHSGLIMFAAVVIYFVVVHGTGVRRLPKELAVATLFAAGTFIVPWTVSPNPVATLAPQAILFMTLCLANLTMIEVWEWNDLLRRPAPGALTRSLGSSMFVLLAATAIVGIVLGRVLGSMQFYLGISLSSAALACLYASGARLSADVRRVLADTALLLPVLFLL